MRSSNLILFMAAWLCAPACKKSAADGLGYPISAPSNFTFKVMYVNPYCTNFNGKSAVTIKCIHFPQGDVQSSVLAAMNADSVFITTSLPDDFMTINTEFDAAVSICVDWKEMAVCQSLGYQLHVTNVH